jgi:predicted dehydrogenase
LRYLPSTILMKELLKQNIIGNVHNVFTNVGQFLPQWRKDKDFKNSVSAQKFLGGGVLLELSHELDYLQWFFGELNYNYSVLRNSLELSLEVEEIADILLTTPSGTLCQVHMDFIQKNPQRKNSFIGSKGRLDWDILNNSITLFKENHIEVIYEDPDWDKNQMYIEMLKDFISSISGMDNKCISLSEASKTVKLIEVIKKSSQWGVVQ